MITVAKLINLLKAQPPDAPVAAHGCDCSGLVTGLRLTDGVVNLLRGGDLDVSYDTTRERIEGRR